MRATCRSRIAIPARRTSSTWRCVLDRLAPWLADPTRRKLGQNLKYDEHVLANHGLVLAGVAHDTLLESYVLEAHRPHDMDNLAWRHLGVKTLTYAEVAGKGAKQIGFDQVALDEATAYSAEDVDITLQLHRHLYPQLAADPKLDHVYTAIEMPVREILFRMEREGVMIDAALLAAQSRELGEKAMALEQQAYALAGQPFNLSSPKQLGDILFQKMKLPALRKTSTGQPSTDEDVLTELAADYPAAQGAARAPRVDEAQVDVHRQAPADGQPRDGARAHDVQPGDRGDGPARVERSESAEHSGAHGRRAADPRGVHRAARSRRHVRRLLADRAADHGASVRRPGAPERVSDRRGHPSRDGGGNLRRSAVRGELGAAALHQGGQLRPDLRDGRVRPRAAAWHRARGGAQQFIDKYFQRYPGVARYMQSTREFAREHGYVETVFGRRLWLPDIKAAGGPRRAGAERAAINAPMQGTAADLVKLAMIEVQGWIDRERLATKLVLQVHDELVLEVPESELARVKTELPQRMTSVASAGGAARRRCRCRPQLGEGALARREPGSRGPARG